MDFQPPIAESYTPILGRCVTRPSDAAVLPYVEHDGSNGGVGNSGRGVDNGDGADQPQPARFSVEVMNTSPDSKHAYMRIPREPISLDHHRPGWGMVYFGVIVNKVGPGVYQAPSQQDAQLVAIKRLNLAVVDKAIGEGSNENPYREICRAQELGDNIHVLKPIETMKDDEFLYFIMPYCASSLCNFIPWENATVQENMSAAIYQNILENIQYLHNKGICHRDIKPENCLVLNGRVVFTDLAMSFRIPPTRLVAPIGRFGTNGYLPPEIMAGAPFCARSNDLWAATVTLFNLLTGERAWECPVRPNVLYNYLVLAGGLNNPELNERLMERYEEYITGRPTAGILGLPPGVLIDGRTRLRQFQRITQRCMGLSDEARDLLTKILREEYDPQNLIPVRLSTVEALNHPWMMMHVHNAG